MNRLPQPQMQNSVNPTTNNLVLTSQVGAVLFAIVASACCWLPLLLVALGTSSQALASQFEPWRPVLLPITFWLMAMAFYFDYRKPMPVGATIEASGTQDSCRASPTAGDPSCCSNTNSKDKSVKRASNVALWLVTLLVLAFSLFPNYLAVIAGASQTHVNPEGPQWESVRIEGMTCEACAITLETHLKRLPVIAAALVDYKTSQARLDLQAGRISDKKVTLKGISDAGYVGHFILAEH